MQKTNQAASVAYLNSKSHLNSNTNNHLATTPHNLLRDSQANLTFETPIISHNPSQNGDQFVNEMRVIKQQSATGLRIKELRQKANGTQIASKTCHVTPSIQPTNFMQARSGITPQ